MIKVGITGQAGFIGTHLYNYLNLNPGQFQVVPFKDEFFQDPYVLRNWTSQCDAIVHLAALNRHNDPETIYETNLRLIRVLLSALEDTGSKPHILFSSSSQEEHDNPYGKSKKDGRNLIAEWSAKNEASFTGLVIPNVFGPFGSPYYNSVVATFSHQIAHGETPRIDVDKSLQLIYVGELTQVIVKCILNKTANPELRVSHTSEYKVSEILDLLNHFNKIYAGLGEIPSLQNPFERNLFNTFRTYMDIPNHFPVALTHNTDERGSFIETMRLGIGGQVSFSTTRSGITRGNHYHTRKIERFVVIKGEALIQLRRIGTDEVIDFHLDGNSPSYVDMPIWYTHNITNVGNEDLYTLFWINEFFDPEDPDTYYETV